MLELIKKIALSGAIIALFALYAIQKQSGASIGNGLAAAFVTNPTEETVSTETAATVAAASATAAGSGSGANEETETAAATTAASETATATNESESDSLYVDGTYTGDEADAHWGDIQVEVTIAGAEITDIQVSEYPTHRDRSVEINTESLPALISEAIAAQSADIDTVSGASDTSEAFMESLDSALQQAIS